MLIIVNVIITIIARNVLILNNFECNNRKYTLVFSKAVVSPSCVQTNYT